MAALVLHPLHPRCRGSIFYRTSAHPLVAICSQVFDESNSPYTAANEALFADNAPNGGLDDYDFTTFLLHHAINGKMYCSLTGLNAAVGDRVRWHIATLVCFCSSNPGLRLGLRSGTGLGLGQSNITHFMDQGL